MNQRRGFLWILALSLPGLAVSLYLTWLYQQILTGDLSEFSICDFSRHVSCGAVSASPWAEWFAVPIAWFGAMVYLLWMCLAILGLKGKNAPAARALIFLSAMTAVAIDLRLGYIMAFQIRSLCLLCLLTYILNLFILFLSWHTMPVPRSRHLLRGLAAIHPLRPRAEYPLLIVLHVVAGLSLAGAERLRVTVAKSTANFNAVAFSHFSATAPRFEVDTSQDPYLGGKNAPLTIVEFSDFQCPYCRKAHLMLQALLPSYADEVKFVFKNLPLGIDCNPLLKARYGRDVHPSACTLARLGEAAHRQHRFWALHDLIFRRQPQFEGKKLSEDALLRLAEAAGLDINRLKIDLEDPGIDRAVSADVQEAYRAGIHATPTFLFNGLKIEGMPPSARILQRIIEIELRRAVKPQR